MTKIRQKLLTKQHIYFLILAALLMGTVSKAKAADIWMLKEAKASFEAIGKPGFLRINGENAAAEGELMVSGDMLTGGEVRVELDTLQTGIELRDEHMREKYLETKKYPLALFKINPTKLQVVSFTSEKDLDGVLTLHGISQPFTLKITAHKVGNNYEGTASGELNVSDFSIAIPTYLGIKVADKVKLKAVFQAVHKPSK